MNADLAEAPVFANPTSRLDVMPYAECVAALRAQHVGRVGFVDDGQIVVVPVNYAFVAGSIIFRSALGAKVSHAELGDPMSFEIDAADDATQSGWSVLAKGVSEHVDDPWLTDMYAYLGEAPWLRDVPRDEWVRIRVETITGRRVVPGSGPASAVSTA